jgi:hypothetical protein
VALIKCADCGKEVSIKAAACPGCGAPIAGTSSHPRVTRTGARWEGWGFILIIVGGLVGIVASPPLSTFGGIAAFVGIVVFIIGRFK